jgi:hypothetical protein
MKKLALLIFVLFLTVNSVAQDVPEYGHDHEHNQEVYFPDIPGYQTLTCDFHMHTVFSDGSVWPNVRVQEANREGIDCISTTEHLEYQPHSEDIAHPDRNRAYEIASEAAEGTPLIVVNGSEITRSMPPGHTNAIFIEDANLLLQEEAMDAFDEARKQKAFVFTNHPNWTAQRDDGIARYEPMHLELIEAGMLHGIEIVNETTFSEEAIGLALEYNLTFIGTSDIHGLVDWLYEIPHGGHRPLTLVFAGERTKESMKTALFEQQTVVWFNDMFMGRQEWLNPILRASLDFEVVGYGGETSVLNVKITNPTHSRFILQNQSNFTFHEDGDVIIIEPQHSKMLAIKTLDRVDSVSIPFTFLNAIFAPGEHPVLEFEFFVGD